MVYLTTISVEKIMYCRWS